jgi:hypothetical protein
MVVHWGSRRLDHQRDPAAGTDGVAGPLSRLEADGLGLGRWNLKEGSQSTVATRDSLQMRCDLPARVGEKEGALATDPAGPVRDVHRDPGAGADRATIEVQSSRGEIRKELVSGGAFGVL